MYHKYNFVDRCTRDERPIGTRHTCGHTWHVSGSCLRTQHSQSSGARGAVASTRAAQLSSVVDLVDGGHGGGGGVPGGVGVGQGAVEEDLGLGRGGGKSENNLHRAHGETHYWTLLTKRGTYRLQHGCDGWFGWWTLTKEPGQGAAL